MPVWPPERLQKELAPILRGQLRLSRPQRLLYATDASIYQVEPLAVVIPADADDLAALTTFAGQHALPLLPRGGGTSLAGQCVNQALVADCSPTMRRVLAFDPNTKVVHVEPGISIDELNRWLEAQRAGLFFAPDPATAAQACIGGCLGNNAAGARSIRYGRTSENLAGIEVALSSGQRLWLEPSAGRHNSAALRLAEQVAAIVQTHAPAIRARFPKTIRRNAGYALDMILAQLDRGATPEELDLSPLLCGSEGSLAVTLSAKLKLHPIPKFKGLAIISFATLEEAILAAAPAVNTGALATAVELLDDVVLQAAAGNDICKRYLDLLPTLDGRLPGAVLYVEYQETQFPDQVTDRFASLRGLLNNPPMATYVDQQALLRAWALRKAGEPLLHGLAGHRKPVTCVEDNAVPLENLVPFVAGFKQIITRHGTKAAYWAHASVGVLHVRPMLDLHDPADRQRMQEIAVEVADLARASGGIMSGEHGDGRIRGPLLERFFGPDLMAAFRQIKQVFDPAGVLNPTMVVDPAPIPSITQHLRVLPQEKPIAIPNVETYFDYSHDGGFPQAIEMCNGAGVCRKTAGGVMCPSYRATLDERHSTRGRANALRLAISGQLPSTPSSPQPAWDDPETIETLALCLSCKACKSECPSNVDLAKLKAEYTAQRYRHQPPPLSARVLAHIRTLNRLGSRIPRLANALTSLRPVRAVLNWALDLSPHRSLPALEPSLYRWFARRPKESPTSPPLVLRGRDRVGAVDSRESQSQSPPSSQLAEISVVLYADCFTTYNEPSIGRSAVAVLEAFGYRVLFPKVGCCGRSMISMGLLQDAITSIDAVLEQLRPSILDPAIPAIIVCEPSCLSAMRDEWLSLKLQTDLNLRHRLAEKAMLLEEFLERNWDKHPTHPITNPSTTQIILHTHCHQKALGLEDFTAAALRRLAAGHPVQVLPSGCCGMAGAFGYMNEHYDLSMKIGEQSLFPALRQSPPNALIVAPGTSCRHQIRDGTAKHALHPAQVLAKALAANNFLVTRASGPCE